MSAYNLTRLVATYDYTGNVEDFFVKMYSKFQ